MAAATALSSESVCPVSSALSASIAALSLSNSLFSDSESESVDVVSADSPASTLLSVSCSVSLPAAPSLPDEPLLPLLESLFSLASLFLSLSLSSSFLSRLCIIIPCAAPCARAGASPAPELCLPPPAADGRPASLPTTNLLTTFAHISSTDFTNDFLKRKALIVIQMSRNEDNNNISETVTVLENPPAHVIPSPIDVTTSSPAKIEFVGKIIADDGFCNSTLNGFSTIVATPYMNSSMIVYIKIVPIISIIITIVYTIIFAIACNAPIIASGILKIICQLRLILLTMIANAYPKPITAMPPQRQRRLNQYKKLVTPVPIRLTL